MNTHTRMHTRTHHTQKGKHVSLSLTHTHMHGQTEIHTYHSHRQTYVTHTKRPAHKHTYVCHRQTILFLSWRGVASHPHKHSLSRVIDEHILKMKSHLKALPNSSRHHTSQHMLTKYKNNTLQNPFWSTSLFFTGTRLQVNNTFEWLYNKCQCDKWREEYVLLLTSDWKSARVMSPSLTSSKSRVSVFTLKNSTQISFQLTILLDTEVNSFKALGIE